MKKITHVLIKKYRKCPVCGKEETNPYTITIELKYCVIFDNEHERIVIEGLTDNEGEK